MLKEKSSIGQNHRVGARLIVAPSKHSGGYVVAFLSKQIGVRLNYLRILCVLWGSLVVVALLLTPEAAHAAGNNQASSPVYTCQDMMIGGIALGNGQPGLYDVYGQLCNPMSGPSRTIQVLVHGSTYDHNYWDWTFEDPTLYSAARAFAVEGYSTFNYDGIGVGESSHPLSTAVTADANSYVLHELVQRLRAGTIGNTSFSHVLLVGHSYGSAIATAEAATYQDVDGLVLTSWLHIINPNFLSLFDLIPANLDPSGRFANLDAGYLTTGTTGIGDDSVRAHAFYNAATSNPKVIASDEATKQTLTAAEASTIGEFLTGEYSLQVNVPTLLVVGNKDELFCTDAVDCSSNASVYQEESPYYSSQAHLQVQVIPDTGHSLNLHYTAPITYAVIGLWSRLHEAPNAS